MNEYMKPEVEVIELVTEAIAGLGVTTSGTGGSEDI